MRHRWTDGLGNRSRSWMLLRGCLLISLGSLSYGFGEEEKEKHEESAIQVHSEHGETVLTLASEKQENLGIAVEPLAAYTYAPEVCAVGALLEDPANVFVLRAPIGGVIRLSEGANWPRLGETLPEGAAVGWIEPLLSPVEQVDLATRRAGAHADLAEAQASLTATRASFDSKRALNTDNKIVTDRALEEAKAKVLADEARLEAAKEIVALIEAAQGQRGVTATNALRVHHRGEVTSLAAQAGESVERGQVLLTAVSYDTLLARVELPIGASFASEVLTARILVLGQEDEALDARRIGPVARTGGAAGGAALVYRLAVGDHPLRPGARVLAYVPTTAEPQSGVLIPRAAVVRDSGRAWVYAQTDKDNFVRREVPTRAPAPEGWLAASGFSVGDKVVVDGAQMLLSEELKPQIEKEKAAEE